VYSYGVSDKARLFLIFVGLAGVLSILLIDLSALIAAVQGLVRSESTAAGFLTSQYHSADNSDDAGRRALLYVAIRS
jgi:hypothetical protein